MLRASWLAHERVELRSDERQRAVGKHFVAVADQIALDLLPLLAQFVARLGEEDRSFRRDRRGLDHVAVRHHVEELGDVVGEIVELGQEGALFAAVLLRQLPRPAALVVDEELITEHRLDRLGKPLAVDRRLDDFEDARLVADAYAAGALRGAAELGQLAVAPLRLHVARREDRHQRRNAREAIDDGVGEDVVALQLQIAPDLRPLPPHLPHADLQQPVQFRDPALLPGDEGLVVEMGVADEEVVLEPHWTLDVYSQ